jgi:hypothetical protein
MWGTIVTLLLRALLLFMRERPVASEGEIKYAQQTAEKTGDTTDVENIMGRIRRD